MAMEVRTTKDIIQAYTHSVFGEELTWDVNAAKRAVRAGAFVTLVEVQPAEMKRIAENNQWDQDHLDNVDPSVPGIAAPFVYRGQIGYILIDGQHRNAKAVRDGLKFYAHLLTDQASQICLMQGEQSAYMPWNRP